MKFLALNLLTALGALLLIRTLGAPFMTEAARDPLSGVVVFLAVLTPLLERWLRPREAATPGSHVRKVMATTMIKMFAMLILILVYLFLGGPDPKVFGLAAYLVYAAFTGILVAETMRHSVPPTDPR
jgi:hypothetical protein